MFRFLTRWFVRKSPPAALLARAVDGDFVCRCLPAQPQSDAQRADGRVEEHRLDLRLHQCRRLRQLSPAPLCRPHDQQFGRQVPDQGDPPAQSRSACGAARICSPTSPRPQHIEEVTDASAPRPARAGESGPQCLRSLGVDHALSGSPRRRVLEDQLRRPAAFPGRSGSCPRRTSLPSVCPTAATWSTTMSTAPATRSSAFAPGEIIHFRYPDPRDPYLGGLSPLRACWEAAALNSRIHGDEERQVPELRHPGRHHLARRGDRRGGARPPGSAVERQVSPRRLGPGGRHRVRRQGPVCSIIPWATWRPWPRPARPRRTSPMPSTCPSAS